jgi:hypothetical protein
VVLSTVPGGMIYQEYMSALKYMLFS